MRTRKGTSTVYEGTHEKKKEKREKLVGKKVLELPLHALHLCLDLAVVFLCRRLVCLELKKKKDKTQFVNRQALR